ncbi:MULTISPECIES: aminoglycoside phosphotransferase family protein [Bacillales]|uniref:aminoglycoside phosphotransferase family protein n=1 Tax=Bacillales TaxID=1385 RepID=UPI00119FB6BD|nr:aminoglycoside phosphotransferase family protein [Paenibacillus sp. Y412MC10]
MNSENPTGQGESLILSAEKSVVRRGQVVYRPCGEWTPSVHSLLRHLKQAGFTSLPDIIDSGRNEEGQETLSYVEGEFVHPGPWSDEAIVAVGRLLRQLHDASATFSPGPQGVWKPWFLRELGDAGVVYSHGDIAPWNMVTRDGMPYALIDWEFAGPVHPLVELARVCWLFPQLHDDDVAERVGLPDANARARQLRLLVDAYGVEPSLRTDLLDMIVEVVVRETAEEAIEQQVSPETEGLLWGIAWRARSAAWILRHRGILEKALNTRLY